MTPLIILLLALALALMLGLAACGSSTTTTTVAPVATTAAPPTTATPTTATPPQAITVSAASSLKAAFTTIGGAFDTQNNAKTTLHFDASGTLQKQIEGGAPVDVFASAAHKQMDALLKGSFVDSASVEVFATNGIILVVPADSTLGITSFEDLTKADVTKIAYGDPKVAPHGVAAEKILTSLGSMDEVKPKVVYTANASQTVDYVVRGEVDAGIMFTTDGQGAGDKVEVVATADQAWYTPVEYPIGVVTAGTNKTAAQAFADFVLGPEGQAILKEYGFLPPPAASSTTTSPPTT